MVWRCAELTGSIVKEQSDLVKIGRTRSRRNDREANSARTERSAYFATASPIHARLRGASGTCLGILGQYLISTFGGQSLKKTRIGLTRLLCMTIADPVSGMWKSNYLLDRRCLRLSITLKVMWSPSRDMSKRQ